MDEPCSEKDTACQGIAKREKTVTCTVPGSQDRDYPANDHPRR